jgi:hypothetical protein
VGFCKICALLDWPLRCHVVCSTSQQRHDPTKLPRRYHMLIKSSRGVGMRYMGTQQEERHLFRIAYLKCF